MQARREWSEISQVLGWGTHLPGILYPAKGSFKSKGKIKTFIKQKLREFVASKPVLQEMLCFFFLKFFREKEKDIG